MLYLYDYPDLRFIRSYHMPQFVSIRVAGDELYLEDQGIVDVYRLNHSDSLLLTRSFRVATVPYSVGKVQPLGKDTYILTGSSDIDVTHEYHIVNPETGTWKSGGAYHTVAGRIRRIDPDAGQLIMEDGIRINLEYIVNILFC